MSQLPSFETLHQLADQSAGRVGVAVAGGANETVIAACTEAAARGWIVPLLCGEVAEIKRLASELNADLSNCELIHSEVPAQTAVEQIQAGRASLLMKGQIATPDLMKAILNRETGLRTGRVISQMVLMEILRDEKRFLMTDTGVTISPSLEQKQDLLAHLVETAHKLDCPLPNLALMSATEKINEAMPDTLDAAALIDFAEQKLAGRCRVSGPLSFDLAYAEDAGKRKQLDNPVIGNADGMLFPNLLSANLTVKAIMYTAGCRFGGVLCGTKVPVVFMSRADDTATRLNSLAYAIRLTTWGPKNSSAERR